MKEKNRDSGKSYAPFAEWIWKSFDGKKRVNIDEFVDAHREDFFMIGTDSKNYCKSKICRFTSVLIAYRMGRGGSVIINTDKVPFMDKSRLRQRLLLEAMRSLEVAWYLDSKVNDRSIIQVHIDVNPNLKWRSSQYKEELVGLVSSQGFSYAIKPDSFAATKVADKRC